MTATTQGATGVRLTGSALSAEIRARVSTSAAVLTAADRVPRLAVVVATTDESTGWYVRSIAAAASKVGIRCDIVNLGDTVDGEEIDAVLCRLSSDASVHGIILQTPLPAGVGLACAASAIDPAKDVDGANPASLGCLAAGLPAFPSATAQAVVALLEYHDIPVAGREVAVVGRSTVVGKPLAHLLLDRNATVTVCHSRTVDLAAVTRRAEILVAAVGRPGLIGSKHVDPGAVVIDVGTNATDDGGLVGDVDPAVEAHAAGLTRFPGASVRSPRPSCSSTPSVRRRKETVCDDALRLRLFRG
jgi:methylenetetrahydrofolate dehydrogenase (NADP+) / methenyltetrahydrofolate cyclohydrolase